MPVTRTIQSLTWLDQSDANAPLAPSTIDFSVAASWQFQLPGAYHFNPIFPRGVAVDNSANGFSVNMAIGPLLLTVNPFERSNIDFPVKAEFIVFSSAVTIGTVAIAFYVIPPPSSGTNVFAATAAAQAAVASLILGTMNPIINSEFKVWPQGTTLAGGAAKYGPEGWQFIAAAGACTRQPGIANSEFAAQVQRTAASANTNPIILATQLQSSDSFFAAGFLLTLANEISFGADFSGTGVLIQIVGGVGIDENVLTGFTGALVIASGSFNASGRVAITSNSPVPANITQLGIILSYTPTGAAGANDWFRVGRFQFDTGTTPQSFRPVPEAAERSRCEFFFERLNESGGVQYQFGIGYGTNIGNTGNTFISFTRKRINPAISAIDAGAPSNYTIHNITQGTDLTCNSFTPSTPGDLTSALISLTVGGGLAPGDTFRLQSSVSANPGQIDIDARM